MAERVFSVEAFEGDTPRGNFFQVATGVCGFINHFSGRLVRPNASVKVHHENGAADGTLMVQLDCMRQCERIFAAHS